MRYRKIDLMLTPVTLNVCANRTIQPTWEGTQKLSLGEKVHQESGYVTQTELRSLKFSSCFEFWWWWTVKKKTKFEIRNAFSLKIKLKNEKRMYNIPYEKCKTENFQDLVQE